MNSSTLSSFDVLILSAFGRGHWLACALQSEGLKVGLVDISTLFEGWTPEDWEGPFGFFHDGFQLSQMDFLMAGDVVESSPVGFVFWLPSGPLELRGPLYAHRSRALGLHERVKRELQSQKSLSEEERKKWQENCLEESFSEFWPIYMAHQMSASRFLPKPQFPWEGAEPLPLFAPFFIRYTTANGYERALDYISRKGVSVFSCSKIPEFGFSKTNSKTKPKKLEWIELEGGTGAKAKAKAKAETETETETRIGSGGGERLKSRFFVSTLSGEESHFIHPSIGKALFPEGFAKSEWSWVRYRLQLEDSPQSKVLPLHFVLLQDIYAPWTHDNLALIQRTFFPNVFNLWLRLSSERRFDPSYLDQQVKKVLHFWQSNLLNINMKVLDYPLEYNADPLFVGPRPFSLFNSFETNTSSLKKMPFGFGSASGSGSGFSSGFSSGKSNTILCSPEYFSRLDINSRLQWEERCANAFLTHPAFSKGLKKRLFSQELEGTDL